MQSIQLLRARMHLENIYDSIGGNITLIDLKTEGNTRKKERGR
jgi:hypothetical protein